MRERGLRTYSRAMALIASMSASGRYPPGFQGNFNSELEAMNIKMGSADNYMHEGKMKNSLKFWSRAAMAGEQIIWTILQIDAWIKKTGRYPNDEESEGLYWELQERFWEEAPDLPGEYYGAEAT